VKPNSRYPSNWKEISDRVKAAANYRCEKCTQYGLPPGKRYVKIERSHRQKISLQVHHWNRDPSDNHWSNLGCLCSSCHLIYHQQGRGNITPGQLALSLKVRQSKIKRKPKSVDRQLSLLPLLSIAVRSIKFRQLFIPL
jgi:predicted HNH restriction endonuclease